MPTEEELAIWKKVNTEKYEKWRESPTYATQMMRENHRRDWIKAKAAIDKIFYPYGRK